MNSTNHKDNLKIGDLIRITSVDFQGREHSTNEFRDSWFVGFTPRILALAWVGFDKDDENVKKQRKILKKRFHRTCLDQKSIGCLIKSNNQSASSLSTEYIIKLARP